MKYLLAIILSVGITCISFSQKEKQDFTKSADTDEVATEVLEKVTKKYEAYSSIYAQFTLEVEFPEEPKDIQKGSMTTQGEKYHVDLPEFSMISDSKVLWVLSKKNNECQLNDLEEDEDLAPQDFYNFYKKGNYVYALMNESFEEGIAIQQIEFKPLDEDSEYSKIRLTVEKNTSSVRRVKVFNKDGSRFTLHIDKISFNKNFDNAHFVFDKKNNPDVHVEDLRL